MNTHKSASRFGVRASKRVQLKMAIYSVVGPRIVGSDKNPLLVPGDLLFGGEYFVASGGGVQYRFQAYAEDGADKGMVVLPADWLDANVNIFMEEPDRKISGQPVEGAAEKRFLERLKNRGTIAPRPIAVVPQDSPKPPQRKDEPTNKPDDGNASKPQKSKPRDFLQDYNNVLKEISTGGKNGGPVDYASTGTDPKKYVERFPEALRKALIESDAKIVLHRETFGEMQGHVASVIQEAKKENPVSDNVLVLPCGMIPKGAAPTKLETGKHNYPAEYQLYRPENGPPEYHIFGLDGESWVIKTLYMLAQFGLDPKRLVIAEDDFDIAGHVNQKVDQALDNIHDCDGLASLTIGSIGALMIGVEKLAMDSPRYDDLLASHQMDQFQNVLTQRQKVGGAFEPAKWMAKLNAGLEKLRKDAEKDGTQKQKYDDCKKALDDVTQAPSAENISALATTADGSFLKTAARPAIEAATSSLESEILAGQLERLKAIRATPDLSDSEKLEMVKNDINLSTSPLLEGALKAKPNGEQVRDALFPREELPGGTMSLLRVGGKCHLMLSVTDVHGDLCYWIVRRVLEKHPGAAINFQGTCGSVDESVPKGSMVVPQSVTNLEPGGQVSTPVAVKNGASAQALTETLGKGAPQIRSTVHANNCTMLQEYNENMETMRSADHRTVDMESYFVMKACKDAHGTGGLKIILQVSDVASSKEHSQQSETRTREDPEVYAAKCGAITKQFGLE